MLFGYELAHSWSNPAYARRRRRNVHPLHPVVQENQAKCSGRYTNRQKRPGVEFRAGSSVMLRRHKTFDPVWEGPFRVIPRISPEIYEVERNGVQSFHHVDDLRPTPPGNDPLVDMSEYSTSDKDDISSAEPESDVQANQPDDIDHLAPESPDVQADQPDDLTSPAPASPGTQADQPDDIISPAPTSPDAQADQHDDIIRPTPVTPTRDDPSMSEDSFDEDDAISPIIHV